MHTAHQCFEVDLLAHPGSAGEKTGIAGTRTDTKFAGIDDGYRQPVLRLFMRTGQSGITTANDDNVDFILLQRPSLVRWRSIIPPQGLFAKTFRKMVSFNTNLLHP